ncbi:hypothetical protein [Dethiosulfatarculus sandiegensis]|nr:hypothetical protein [Dethiosulfatarculus sandiegensis]
MASEVRFVDCPNSVSQKSALLLFIVNLSRLHKILIYFGLTEFFELSPRKKRPSGSCSCRRFTGYRKTVIGPVCLALSISLLLALCFSNSVWAKQGFIINPVEKTEQLRLLSADAWPHLENSEQGNLLKISYLRGVIDALQYARVAPKTTEKSLEKLKGLTLQQLAHKLDNFYSENPMKKDIPPAAVIVLYLTGKTRSDAANLPQ